jgi:hypothetical protein
MVAQACHSSDSSAAARAYVFSQFSRMALAQKLDGEIQGIPLFLPAMCSLTLMCQICDSFCLNTNPEGEDT